MHECISSFCRKDTNTAVQRLRNNCRATIKYMTGHSLWFGKPYGPMSVGRFMITEI